MKKELDLDYDINVVNMIPFTKSLPNSEMVLHEAEFYNLKGNAVKMMVLKNDIEFGSIGCKQIFQMKDGKFILEVEDEEGVEYFFSNKIEDLL